MNEGMFFLKTTLKLTGLSELAGKLPEYAVITDDPMRTKMLASHWLDNAKAIYELRGLVGYSGNYKDAALALITAGFGETSALLHLHDAYLLGVRRFIYMGECVSRVPDVKLRDVVIAQGGDAELTSAALRASIQFSIPALMRDVATDDRLFLKKTDISGDVVDFASGAVAGYAAAQGIAAISILTVSQNTASGERMEEHERQSRMHAAAQLVFETFALDAQL